MRNPSETDFFSLNYFFSHTPIPALSPLYTLRTTLLANWLRNSVSFPGPLPLSSKLQTSGFRSSTRAAFEIPSDSHLIRQHSSLASASYTFRVNHDQRPSPPTYRVKYFPPVFRLTAYIVHSTCHPLVALFLYRRVINNNIIYTGQIIIKNWISSERSERQNNFLFFLLLSLPHCKTSPFLFRVERRMCQFYNDMNCFISQISTLETWRFRQVLNLIRINYS